MANELPGPRPEAVDKPQTVDRVGPNGASLGGAHSEGLPIAPTGKDIMHKPRELYVAEKFLPVVLPKTLIPIDTDLADPHTQALTCEYKALTDEEDNARFWNMLVTKVGESGYVPPAVAISI